MQIGATSVALHLPLTHNLRILCRPYREGHLGVHLSEGETDTQGHTVNQWQSWGQITFADPRLLQVTACHKLQTLKRPGEVTC